MDFEEAPAMAVGVDYACELDIPVDCLHVLQTPEADAEGMRHVVFVLDEGIGRVDLFLGKEHWNDGDADSIFVVLLV